MVNNRAASFSSLVFFSFCLIGCFYSFPAFASSENFSFIEFNIAFVLGLSLPVLLITSIAKLSPVISKRYPILLTLALLALLYCMSYLSHRNDYIALTFSALILQLSFFWSAQFHYEIEQEEKANRVLWQAFSYGMLSLLFLVVLWLGVASPEIAWLVFSVLQISLFSVNLFAAFNKSKTLNQRSLVLLAVNITFTIAVYVWLNGQLSFDLLAILAVLTYLVAMVNGCWQVISVLVSRLKTPVESVIETDRLILDPSTNLPSYQCALKKFEYSIKHQKSARYAAIAFKPLNFQQVNAVLGHHNSDILLLQLAYCLQKAIEDDGDLLNFCTEELPVRIARLQGLHFLIVMDVAQSKHSDEVIIEQLCQRLAQAVPGPMSFKSFSLFFKLAFGVAFVGKDSDNVNEVIACAEDALLQADKQQKQVSFFAQGLAIFNQQQLQKMEQLKQDIATGAINWRVQPQIEMATKHVLGFELLLTWQGRDGEKLDFNEVMVIAQQSGDAFALCRKMVTQAFTFLQQLHRLGAKVQIAIKLSNSCLLEPDIVDFIEQQAIDFAIDCEYLLIEIKEEILLSASREAKASIDQLKFLGVKIAIDEFSGSYEALRYLRKLAVSEIKINCHALAKAEAGSSDKAIINALINLTRKMKLPLIGTNIDNVGIEKMFIAMGGEYAQGKHYSSGINFHELPFWLDAWQQQYAKNDS